MVAWTLFVLPAQSQLLKRIGDRAKQKVEQKIDEKVDKSIDDATSGKKKDDKKPDNKDPKEGNKNGAQTPSTETTVSTNGVGTTATLKTYSKYDFIPGDKVVAVEDFAQDNIGDFPAKWNTNSTGEVVTVDGQSGHWLMVKKQGRFIPDYIKDLPENFTLQFDVLCNEKFSFYSNPLKLYLLTGDNKKGLFEYAFIQADKRSGVELSFHPTNAGNNGGNATILSFEDGATVINNQVATNQFNSYAGKTKLNVSVWRQKQRIRVYFNEEKVFDLPRAFAADKTYSTLLFEIWSTMANDQDKFLIGNIKMAIGAPDTRNKLITEGKFVTRGILFDVNSAGIKPESYGVLKDIANVLKENADVKIKIIGHTDTDGDDAKNLDLSKRRAEAVKNALVQEFAIDESRMQTDGKGETQPVDKNDTAEGKANNRRVEFIKL